MRSLKCVEYDESEQTYRYFAAGNPLLERDVTSTTDLIGLKRTDPQDPNQFATAGFAALLAGVLPDGHVVERPTIGTAVLSVPMRYVIWTDPLAGPKTFVAGNVARVMALDWQNWNQRSGDIADIIGNAYIRGFGESLFDACVAAGMVKL
jgi:hypothetical protein